MCEPGTVQKSRSKWVAESRKPLLPGTLKNLNVDFLGSGGIGKTTALKYLAITWADELNRILNIFDFVFHITLKEIKGDAPLENIIVKQHKALCAHEVQASEISQILNGNTTSNVLVLMDGFDEYNQTNSHINDILDKNSLWNTWFILTSRPTRELDDIKMYMDAEAEITGFSDEHIREYATNFLGSAQQCDLLLEKAKQSGVSDLLHIPIFLQMCSVSQSGKSS